MQMLEEFRFTLMGLSSMTAQMMEAAPITSSLGFIPRMIPPATWSHVGKESKFEEIITM